MIIDVVMPVKEGRYLPQKVLISLLQQGIPFRLFVSTKVSNGDYPAARNNIKQYGHSEFVLMLDNDIVLPDGALSQLIDFLQSHREYAAIGLPKQDFSAMGREWHLHAPHVDMSCVLFRGEVLKQLTFRWPPPGENADTGGCECGQACRDLRRMGWEIGFLPGGWAEHIVQTEAYQ